MKPNIELAEKLSALLAELGIVINEDVARLFALGCEIGEHFQLFKNIDNEKDWSEVVDTLLLLKKVTDGKFKISAQIGNDLLESSISDASVIELLMKCLEEKLFKNEAFHLWVEFYDVRSKDDRTICETITKDEYESTYYPVEVDLLDEFEEEDGTEMVTIEYEDRTFTIEELERIKSYYLHTKSKPEWLKSSKRTNNKYNPLLGAYASLLIANAGQCADSFSRQTDFYKFIGAIMEYSGIFIDNDVWKRNFNKGKNNWDRYNNDTYHYIRDIIASYDTVRSNEEKMNNLRNTRIIGSYGHEKTWMYLLGCFDWDCYEKEGRRWDWDDEYWTGGHYFHWQRERAEMCKWFLEQNRIE